MNAEIAGGQRHQRWLEELQLAHFDPSSPGMPFWLPHGTAAMGALRRFFLREHLAAGYEEVSTPQLADLSVFRTSGHVPHFQDSMFIGPLDEGRRYGIKPGNCPGSMLLFAARRHSYRELPVRWYCEDVLHRRELSGVLTGLLRVQEFRQDDTHVFLAERQAEEEFGRILALARRLYGVFGLDFRLRLGTAPQDRLGDGAAWERATDALRRALDAYAGRDGYEVAAGEGAFYGPKIDILMTDALGREWQTGTMQLDLQMPGRFGCAYTGPDGARHTPAVIHRAIAGSFERFLGVLLEHGDGRLPFFIAPVQVLVAPVTQRQVARAREVRDALAGEGFRVEVGDGSQRLGALVRQARERRTPCLVVIGDQELREGTVGVRMRDEEGRWTMTPGELIGTLRDRLPRA
jgi:threonyl-tRNA synthetase